MPRGATISILALTSAVLALAVFTQTFGNSWKLLTDGGQGGYFVPAESSIFSFRETEANPGSGGWWIRGEDRANFYAIDAEDPGYFVFPKAAVSNCIGFNPADSASWCSAETRKGQHERSHVVQGAESQPIGGSLQLTITGVDYAPDELEEQMPIVVDLIREIPGPDRPDYWLGKVHKPIRWIRDNHEVTVTHVVLGSRFVGTQVAPGVKDLPVGIAYVTDQTLLSDATLDFAKCSYVAIGFSHETGGGNSK